MTSAFAPNAAASSTSLIIGVVLLSNAPQMALIAVAITPIYAWMYRQRRPIIKKLNQELRHTNACLYGLVSQKLDGMKVIQAYARETGEILNFHRLTAVFMRDALDTQKVSAALGRQAGVLTTLSSCAIFLYGGKMVLDGEMQLGKMMFIHTTTMTLFQPVLEFTQLTFVLQRSIATAMKQTAMNATNASNAMVMRQKASAHSPKTICV